ncbi:MAG: hypothetical protein II321_04015 [Lachnospiraceae bacterium]|nr:hypothetical protein [Lachnospiraceae bacterium]
MNQIKKEILNKIRQALHRIRFLEWISYFTLGILGGVGVCVVVSILLLVLPIYYENRIMAGIMIAFLILSMVAWCVKCTNLKGAALLLDEKTKNQERFVTALENIEKDDAISALQREDTLARSREMEMKKIFPFQPEYKKYAGILTGIFLIVILSMVPTDAKEKADLLQEKHELIEEKKEEAEEILEKVEKMETMDNSLKQGVEEEFSKALEELKEMDSIKEMESLMERTEYKMQEMMMDAFKDSLPESSSLSQEEMEQLAEMLSEMAETMDAEQLADLAEKLASGELGEMDVASLMEAVNQSMNGASVTQIMESLESSNSAGAESQEGNQNQGSGGNSTGSGENNQNSQNSSESGNSSENGSGNSSGNGSGNGSESGNSSGNGNGSGSGTGSGSGSGSGSGWNYGSQKEVKDHNTYEGEMIAVPLEEGDDGNLSGDKVDGEGYLTHSKDGLGYKGTMVSYGDVVTSYQQQAYTNIENAKYPSGMEGIIKDYFEQLNQ